MKISILKSDNKTDDSPINNNFIINKNSISSLILTTKVVIALLYAFGLGYSLFFFGDEYINVGFKFLCLLIISYIFIDFPYSLVKALLLPKAFTKDNINLVVNPYTLSIDIWSKIKIPKKFVILSLIIPFIFFAIIPTILSYILEFNMYLYLLASVSAIIGSKDLINLILILKNYSLGNHLKLTSNGIIFYE